MKYNFNKVLIESFLVIGILTLGDTTLQAQIITTIAGNGVQGYSSDGIPATSSELSYPIGVAVDDSGNIYVGDWENNRVRKITISSGNITTIAGNGAPGYSGDGVAATSAEIYYPQDVAVDDSGNVYIADLYNSRVRKVTASTGIISTIAGTGFGAPISGGFSGDGGLATAAELYQAYGVAVDDSGNVFIADSYNNRVRKVTKSTGIITTVAGDSLQGYAGDGGLATNAELYRPYSVAVDDSGNIYISDAFNNRIRKVNGRTSIITTIAGNGVQGYFGDGGQATSAELYQPFGVAVDDAGNVYISDPYNSRIRVVSGYTGIITTYAGNGTQGYSGDGMQATSAELNTPASVAVNGCSNVYIADMYNNRIRKVVNTAPVVTVTPNPALICSGGSSILKASGAIAYFWTPAIGLSATSDSVVTSNPTVTTTYTLEGVANTGCAGTTMVTVTVDLPPILNIEPPSPSVCNGQTIRLNVAGNETNFKWSPSASLSDSTGDTVLATPTFTTVYSVDGTDSVGCSSTGTDTVSIFTAPPLIIQPPSPVSVCLGQGVMLSVPTSGADYIWSPSFTLSSSTGDTVVATPLIQTTYVVSGIDSLGCAVTSDSEVVMINTGPSKPTIMQHDSVLISSSTQSNQWLRNDTVINGATNQDYIFTTSGYYQVTVSNPANGCSTTSDSMFVKLTDINQLIINSGKLTVYPNPTSGEINMNVGTSAGEINSWNLQVTDVLGRTVYTKRSLNYYNKIDLSNRSNGVYFISVINKTGRTIIPVVKQN